MTVEKNKTTQKEPTTSTDAEQDLEDQGLKLLEQALQIAKEHGLTVTPSADGKHLFRKGDEVV